MADLPPFLFAGSRFFVAGAILLGLSLALGSTLPRDWATWRTQGIVGLFLLLGGNAFVVWAEQYVDSGVASIFVVTVALWIAVFDALVGGSRLSPRVLAGLGLGLIGTVLLVGTSPRAILEADLRGPVALTLASASWAVGSVLYKRHAVTKGANPYVAASLQMLVGGTAVTLLGLALGEAGQGRITAAGVAATAYLIVFGSIVGYTAYFYALRHAPPTVVGTYAYVNPVIAVLLGWAVLDEPIGPRTFLAMGLILGAVAWIQLAHGRPRGARVNSRLGAARTSGAGSGERFTPLESGQHATE